MPSSRFGRKRPSVGGYRFYRGVFLISGCALASLLCTFCLHYQLPEEWNSLSDSSGQLSWRTSFLETSQQHGLAAAQTSSRQLSSAMDSTNTTAITIDDATDEEDDIHVVHIVYTRFMQHQSNLTSLGLARVELFREFFVASLSRQSTDNFVVVIRADPQLQGSVRDALMQVLEDDSATTFIYILLGSNENLPNAHQYPDLLERFRTRSNRSSNNQHVVKLNPMSLLEGSIWSGDIDAARDYLESAQQPSSPSKKEHPASRNSIVIETRLDSDDGLHREYLEYLQHHARSTIGHDHHDHSSPWMVSCAGKYVEWQVMAPWEEDEKQRTSEEQNDKETSTTKEEDDSSGLGGLVSLQLKGCLSAGLSVAYFPWKDPTDVPVLRNHEFIADKIRPCRSDKKGKTKIKHKVNCLDFVALNPSVLRARTPTSAGMLNVLWKNSGSTGQGKSHEIATTSNPLYKKYESGARKQQKFQELLWKTTHYFFGLDTHRVRILRQYLLDHMVDIAKDNLQGQCSAGHSCKNSSQVILQSIAASSGTTGAAAAAIQT